MLFVLPELKMIYEKMLNKCSSSPTCGNAMCVPCEGTVMMRVGLSLTLTDNVSKPLKAAGEVISWWLAFE